MIVSIQGSYWQYTFSKCLPPEKDIPTEKLSGPFDMGHLSILHPCSTEWHWVQAPDLKGIKISEHNTFLNYLIEKISTN